MRHSQTAAKTWLRQQTKLGRRAVRGAVALGMLGVAAGIGQAICIAYGLDDAMRGVPAAPLLMTFAVLALVRTGLGWLFERASFEAGARARRRLRTDILAECSPLAPRCCAAATPANSPPP